MKKKVLGLFIALMMLAAMGYTYSASALLDADDEVPGGDYNQVIVHETTTVPIPTFDPGNQYTTQEWTVTDADGNLTPPPATTAPPRFTNRPARTHPNIPWTPPLNFFHYEGGDVIGRDWVCYACAGLDFCIHWMEYMGHDVAAFNPDDEGFEDEEPEMYFVQLGYAYENISHATPFAFNWLLIGAGGGVLLLAIVVVVLLLLRGKRETVAAQTVLLGQDDNFVDDNVVENNPAEQNPPAEDLPHEDEINHDETATDLPDEEMTFSDTPGDEE